MLGMMNCSTDQPEFYATPPGSHSKVDERLFARKDRPRITYGKDGRKYLNGKLLETEENEQLAPSQMWNRVMITQIATSQICNNNEEVQKRRSPKKNLANSLKRVIIPLVPSSKKQLLKGKMASKVEPNVPSKPNETVDPSVKLENTRKTRKSIG
ncbi:hypothetical protein M3Y98_00597000 [Aphelenchoides besseyi]|nr:hypothetical protein M3Y98_00597000 [Aphelenchoides besseyi]